ncbi:hypothetical protein, partial [Salmonella enterica]|uniref:hypothetical protein n=1 Tax=Salmonella enterica TaxID=28901 RepID=UPI003F4CA714
AGAGNTAVTEKDKTLSTKKALWSGQHKDSLVTRLAGSGLSAVARGRRWVAGVGGCAGPCVRGGGGSGGWG